MLNFIYKRLGVIVDLLRQILTRVQALEKGQADTNHAIGNIDTELKLQGQGIADLGQQIHGLVVLANVVGSIADQVNEIHDEVVPGPAVTIELIGSDPEEQQLQ